MHIAKHDGVSISKLHEITGYDRAVITRKLKDAGIPFEKKSRGHIYDQTLALAVLYNNPNAVTEDNAKQRKAIAEAEKAEIAVSKLKGELVSADEMRQAAAELVKNLFQRIVRVEPSVIASRCVGLDAIGIEVQIRESMTTIFNDVRTDLSGYITVEDETEENDEDDGTVPDNG
jgi:hypothetical protein